MILQKQKGREYKGKPIFKWVIVVPPKDIKELDWKEGLELEGAVAKDMYIVRKKGYGEVSR